MIVKKKFDDTETWFLTEVTNPIREMKISALSRHFIGGIRTPCLNIMSWVVYYYATRALQLIFHCKKIYLANLFLFKWICNMFAFIQMIGLSFLIPLSLY